MLRKIKMKRRNTEPNLGGTDGEPDERPSGGRKSGSSSDRKKDRDRDRGGGSGIQEDKSSFAEND